jgi:hypothetical protein
MADEKRTLGDSSILQFNEIESARKLVVAKKNKNVNFNVVIKKLVI